VQLTADELTALVRYFRLLAEIEQKHKQYQLTHNKTIILSNITEVNKHEGLSDSASID
jgi:hypothetical protein